MNAKLPSDELEMIVNRLRTAIDASDRVKAAAEIGELGTPEIAPKVLDAVWEDEKSNVRQLAVQSYAEILGNEGVEALNVIIEKHTDNYVRLYAIISLGTLSKELVLPTLTKTLEDTDQKIRATTIKQFMHLNARETAPLLMQLLSKESYVLAIRNAVEALAIWKYKAAQSIIENILKHSENEEITTICLFALACFGSPTAKTQLQEYDVDSDFRVKFMDTTYRGKDGLLKIVALQS